MPRYDVEFAIEAQRVAGNATANLGARISRWLSHGATPEDILEDLLHDIDNNGPVFGGFLRALGGAGGNAVSTAVRQGELVGYAADSAALRGLLERVDVDEPNLNALLESADPEGASLVEETLADVIEETWVATLRNTCAWCLVLHGQTRTRAEWLAARITPETIHDDHSIAAPCYCRLVPVELAGGRADLMEPLRREGQKGSRRTARSVVQQDLQKSIAARDAALQSAEGRRLLRKLGSARGESQ